MIQQFLETYGQAINLDKKRYDCYFSQGVKRSDFLLFNKQVVCEVKEIRNIEIQSKVEKLSRKENLSEQELKRDLLNSINIALSKANKQIEATKNSLNCQDALGLIILENLMPKDLSTLSLMIAADKKMLGGLTNVDCILCVDVINAFSNLEGSPFRLVQTIARDTERSERLCELLNQLMKDFCSQSDTPFIEGFIIEKGMEKWSVDQYGKYRSYEAKLDFRSPVSEVKLNWVQSLAQFVVKWWWTILLLDIFYDLSIH
jgi:hypothetical protein